MMNKCPRFRDVRYIRLTVFKHLLGIGLLLCASFSTADYNSSDNLPDLGDVTASRYSAQQEHDLGRMWLKMFRSRIKTVDDPLMQDYICLLYTSPSPRDS